MTQRAKARSRHLLTKKRLLISSNLFFRLFEIKFCFHHLQPFIDYFHLFYYGKNEISTGIAEVNTSNEVKAPAGIYNMKGQLLRNTNSTEGLAKGLYIIGGKKVVIK